jgi:hypothetical protein
MHPSFEYVDDSSRLNLYSFTNSKRTRTAAAANNIYVIGQDRTPGNNKALFTKAKI